MNQISKLNEVTEAILKNKIAFDEDGKERKIDDAISRPEAYMLYKMVIAAQPAVSIEVGLAFGISALVFCQAHNDKKTMSESIHYAVDPNQLTFYRNTAIVSVKAAGLYKYLKVLNGPSHLEIPNLLKDNIVVDCAFVDGWHTFDYTFTDFFLIDKMLRPGGYIAFHDVYGRAKQKVINFILTHRKYEIAEDLMEIESEPLVKTVKFFLWRLLRSPSLIFSWYHWKYQTKNSSGLLILRKKENFEPNFDFFKNF